MDSKTLPVSTTAPGGVDAPRVGTLAALLLASMLCLAPDAPALPVSGATLHLPPQDISSHDAADHASLAHPLDEPSAELASLAFGPVNGPGDATRHGGWKSKSVPGFFAAVPSTAPILPRPWSRHQADESPWPAKSLHGHAGIWPWKDAGGRGPYHYDHPPWEDKLSCKPPIHPPPVPEVETWAMMLAGLGLIVLQLRRRADRGPKAIG